MRIHRDHYVYRGLVGTSVTNRNKHRLSLQDEYPIRDPYRTQSSEASGKPVRPFCPRLLVSLKKLELFFLSHQTGHAVTEMVGQSQRGNDLVLWCVLLEQHPGGREEFSKPPWKR